MKKLKLVLLCMLFPLCFFISCQEVEDSGFKYENKPIIDFTQMQVKCLYKEKVGNHTYVYSTYGGIIHDEDCECRKLNVNLNF